MASTLIYRSHQILSGIQVLRETIDRRFAPDDAVETKLQDLEIEVKLLIRELEKEK